MKGERRVKSRGFALVELLIVVTVLAIATATAIFIVAAVTTPTVNHACSTEAKHFESAVTEYRQLHGVVPDVLHGKNVKSSVYSASLALLNDHEIDQAQFSHYGDQATQWSYDAKTGSVTLGKTCT
jgi:prepilin-type N-terminal cleavage/methylation domain-containing protein